jgi:hypothetical protein
MKFKDGMFFTSEQLSPNKELTPEGYLLCKDVPISRVGTFTYSGLELGMDAPQVRIERPASELFKPETISSFEGKPVVVGHGVFPGPDNWKEVAIGHAQNVRRGEGPQRGMLLADLLITDRRGIDLVESGALKEVSCGYDADYVKDGADIGHQRSIVGNHVALVSRGRCGPVCSIGDGYMEKTSLKTILRRFFKDGNEEGFNETLDKIQVSEVKDEDPAPAAASTAPAAPAATEAKPEAKPSAEERLAALEAQVGKLVEAVQAMQSAKAAADEEAKKAAEAKAGDEAAPEAKPEDKPADKPAAATDQQTKDEEKPVPADEVKKVLGDADDICPGIKKPAADSANGGFSREVLARLKRSALKEAGVKTFGDADTLEGAALDVAFAAAAEIARMKKNPVATRRTGDSQSAHRPTNAELNESYAKFWN